MIGGYQIISLHSTNNVLGTSYSIKGLYKKVKKTIKQIKLEDLIIDSIKMENVFINVHLDEDNYVGTFGLYQITFKSDDTYTIEENSSGSSGLYFVTTDDINPPFGISTDISRYPMFQQLYKDRPNECILTYQSSVRVETSGAMLNLLFSHYYKLKEDNDSVVYVYSNSFYYYSSSVSSYTIVKGVIYFTLTSTSFIFSNTL